MTFKYDPFGRRIEKKATDTSGAQPVVKTYSYAYDNEDIVLEYLSTDEGGTITTSTVYYVHGPGIDEPLSIEKDGTSYYYVSDTQGSVTAVLDTNQTLTEVFQYKTFGQTTKVSQLIGNTFAYTGRQWDDETGLYYYRARYYDPNAGRFISKDPIGFAAGDATLYIYVSNNPATWIDPSGLKIDLTTAGQQTIEALVNVLGTTRGLELFLELQNREKTYRIHEAPPGTKPVASNDGIAVTPKPNFNVLFAVPSDNFCEFVKASPSLEAQLAHELGHLADPKLSEMENIELNENPVALELGLPRRIGLERLSW